jgi:hypothetical protein
VAKRRSFETYRATFFSDGAGVLDIAVVVTSFLLGVILFFATYWAGIVWTGFIGGIKKQIKEL